MERRKRASHGAAAMLTVLPHLYLFHHRRSSSAGDGRIKERARLTTTTIIIIITIFAAELCCCATEALSTPPPPPSSPLFPPPPPPPPTSRPTVPQSRRRSSTAPTPLDEKPNVLFIIADDLRPQLGIYGNRAATPNLDELAQQPGALTFERAFAQITVCNPSRASLLCGRRPDRTLIFGFEAGTPAGWTTLPEAFRRSGYLTLGTGKLWHWGPGPTGAWSSWVRKWRRTDDDENETTETTTEAWELPSGDRVDGASKYALQISLPRPAATITPGSSGSKPRERIYPIEGFWPNSNVFQEIQRTRT